MLLQEPWAKSVEDVKRLTTRQARDLFVLPAVDRAERVRGGGSVANATAGKPSPPGHDFSKGLPDKAAFVAGMHGAFGGDIAKWEADWERMKAARQPGAKHGQK